MQAHAANIFKSLGAYCSLAKIFISQIIDAIFSQERLVGAVTSAAIYPTKRALGGAK